MSVTNIILLVLSLHTQTNSQPGDHVFRKFGNTLVGIRSIDYAVQSASCGYYDGTNAVELFKADRLLWARTNWDELPLMVGVGAPQATAPQPRMLSTRETIQPKTETKKPQAETNAPPAATPPPKDETIFDDDK